MVDKEQLNKRIDALKDGEVIGLDSEELIAIGIKRRPFLQSVACGVLGFFGLSTSAEASRDNSQPVTDSEITIGDLFWDKDRVWSDGSKTLNHVNLVLSADKNMDDGVYYYRLGTFMWCGSSYCGAHDRFFTEAEVLMMTKVGNIADIKGFAKEW